MAHDIGSTCLKTAMVYLTSGSRDSFHSKGYLVCYMDSYHKDEINA